MSSTPKENAIDGFAWLMLGSYLCTWTLVIGTSDGWALAVITALGHGGGQLYVLRRRGHVHMSADPVAIPAALVAHLAGIAVLRLLGDELVVTKPVWALLLPVASAWFLGHVAGLAAAFAGDWYSRRRSKTAEGQS